MSRRLQSVSSRFNLAEWRGVLEKRGNYSACPPSPHSTSQLRPEQHLSRWFHNVRTNLTLKSSTELAASDWRRRVRSLRVARCGTVTPEVLGLELPIPPTRPPHASGGSPEQQQAVLAPPSSSLLAVFSTWLGPARPLPSIPPSFYTFVCAARPRLFV